MANRKNDIKARLLATFRGEAEEHLQAITAHLLALDGGLPPAEARGVVEAAFREIHTLKGAARSVSLADVEALCQACEVVLSRVTRGQLVLSRPILNRLQEAVDGVARLLAGSGAPGAVRDLIDRLERSAAEPAPEAAEPLQPPILPAEAPAGSVTAGFGQTDTIRLATAKLDALLLHAEDLLVPKLASEERVREARVLVEALAACRKAGNPGLDSALRAVEARARELLGHLVLDQRTISRGVDGLQDELRRVRLTPASVVLDLFPRMVRDLAREHGKEVEWAAQGADLDVDRQVLEAMKEPLIHLVRNGIDHGIEPPETRAQTGKAPRGRLAVTIASLEGGRIEIRVEDDGGGIDLARVRAAAVRAHLLTAEEAEALTDDQALDIIFRSGLSTSPIITDLSGHGLGLAIVKEHVERLGGQIHIETRA
ncbi:MAG: Hpt domain-containing protein, partial [Candidatus Tectomicrobia bacterium]|nr:Hpt domain-containing protein [Candidatus Tectomicrobia bacterium]